MKFYFFSIKNGKIAAIDSSPVGKASEYIPGNSGEQEVLLYRITGGIISNIMCEARSIEAATKAVELFLSAGRHKKS